MGRSTSISQALKLSLDLMTKNNDLPQQLSPEELAEWRRRFDEANRANVFCHCRQCDEEWVASKKEPCHHCGSLNVQAIACWQFPDG